MAALDELEMRAKVGEILNRWCARSKRGCAAWKRTLETPGVSGSVLRGSERRCGRLHYPLP